MMKKFLIVVIILLSFSGNLLTNISGDIIEDTVYVESDKPIKYIYNNGSLSGYVNDTSMNPVEGALVRVYFHETYRENYSNNFGYYHVTDIPICYCLKNCTASKEGYESDWVMLGISEGTKYDFILTPDGSPWIDPPYGPTEGFVNITYTFYFDIPEDLQFEGIFLIWDWGDGEFSDWMGPYSSGETSSASHAWSAPGVYDIRVVLKDNNGNVNISKPLIIHIYLGSVLRILPGKINGGIGKIDAVIENVGDKVATNVEWLISIKGGILRGINITSSGQIDVLEACDSKQVFTDKFIIGFGGIGITVSASAEDVKEVSQQIMGFVFLFYVYTYPIT